MVKRLQIQDLQGTNQLQTKAGGTQAFVRPVSAKVRPVKPLDFAPLVKGLGGLQEAQDGLKELKELNAAEEIVSNPEYDKVLQGIQADIAKQTSGISSLEERNDIANRIWVRNIEAGHLPKGSGPRTLKKLVQRQAGLQTVRVEGDLNDAITELSKGVDAEGNPVTMADAEAQLAEIIRAGGDIPAISSTFSGSEVYRQTMDQKLARGLIAVQEGQQEALAQAAKGAFGASLRSGDLTGVHPFEGFPSVLEKNEWTEEDTKGLNDYTTQVFSEEDFNKDAFINTSEDYLKEMVATLGADGDLDTGDIIELTNFVTRLSDISFRGLKLGVDGSEGEDGRSPASVLGAMQSIVDRAEARGGTMADKHFNQDRRLRHEAQILITDMVNQGATDAEILSSLVSNDSLLAHTEGRGITETSLADIRNMMVTTRESGEERTAKAHVTDIRVLDQYLADGKPFDEIWTSAEALGVAYTKEGRQWFEDHRGLRTVERISALSSPAGLLIQDTQGDFTRTLPNGLLSEEAAAKIKAGANQVFLGIKADLAKALNAQGLRTPDAEEDFVISYFSDRSGPQGAVGSKIEAVNAQITEQVTEAQELTSAFDLARASGNLGDMRRLAGEADGVLSSTRVASMNTTVQNTAGADIAFSNVTAPDVVDQIKASLTRAATVQTDGNSVEGALMGQRMYEQNSAIDRLASNIVIQTRDLPSGEREMEIRRLTDEGIKGLAEGLGLQAGLKALQEAPTPEQVKDAAFNTSVAEGRRLLGRTRSIGYDQIYPLGAQTEAGIAFARLHTTGTGVFGPDGLAAVQRVQRLGNLESLKEVDPTKRSALAGSLLARGLFPLQAVGSKSYGISGNAKESFGIDQFRYLQSLGFPDRSLDVLRNANSADRTRPEFQRQLADLKAEADILGFTVDVTNAGSNVVGWGAVLTARVDLSTFKHKPMATIYFPSIEAVDRVMPFAAKEAFKEFGWPTDGEAFAERLALFKSQQKQLITMQQDY